MRRSREKKILFELIMGQPKRSGPEKRQTDRQTDRQTTREAEGEGG